MVKDGIDLLHFHSLFEKCRIFNIVARILKTRCCTVGFTLSEITYIGGIVAVIMSKYVIEVYALSGVVVRANDFRKDLKLYTSALMIHKAMK